MAKHTLSKTIKVCLEIDVEVSGTFISGTPGRMYLDNGDPGYPDEPAEFHIEKVLWQGLDIMKALENEKHDFTEMENECIESTIP